MRTSAHVLKMRIKEGAAGYGVYMMLLEILRDADGRSMFYFPEGMAYAINERDVDLVKRVCEDYGLFNIDKDDIITSPWLNAQMAEYDAKKAAAVEAGRRGAAKRYAKAAADGASAAEKVNDPKGTLKAPNSNKPNPNIINQTKLNQTESKSKLLDLSWGNWSGEELFLIARQAGNVFSPLDREELAMRASAQAMKDEPDKNPDVILQLVDAMGFNHEQYQVVDSILDGGRIGTPRMREALRILNDWNARTFRARYPFEHLICKLLDS